jgi:hypothetical protein
MGMKKRALIFLVVSAVVLIGACNSPFGSEGNAAVTDISGNLDFMQISRQGFMGGSVLYNPSQTGTGQLANNVSVAVRLGYAAAETVETGQLVYSDIQEKAQYGLLVVTNIDAQAIAFTVNLYNADGESAGGASYTLNLNERRDINGDGVPDLEYKEPAQKTPRP